MGRKLPSGRLGTEESGEGMVEWGEEAWGAGEKDAIMKAHVVYFSFAAWI